MGEARFDFERPGACSGMQHRAAPRSPQGSAGGANRGLGMAKPVPLPAPLYHLDLPTGSAQKLYGYPK